MSIWSDILSVVKPVISIGKDLFGIKNDVDTTRARRDLAKAQKISAQADLENVRNKNALIKSEDVFNSGQVKSFTDKITNLEKQVQLATLGSPIYNDGEIYKPKTEKSVILPVVLGLFVFWYLKKG